ncbi:ADP-ribosyltransferase [Paenibacillus chondroitinus]|uniref:ADP-ribosyltransferase n=1 Tax=Paenibacillus chondroitinus TaxID=59842 RepID=A0ABU6D667_9BACL|nr:MULTISPECIES: ADP-ribosyltransferase [Paenibacillus]MCY9658129.1 minor capsid protein [Paenibacillus anseongense]MEB4793209.1 ADP-ribosyltransferase [Paenibacillus chondroitinus]
MEQLNEAQLAKGEAYIQDMKREYGKAMASIQKDINAFYQRFAKNNDVDLATARQMLKAGELKELKWSLEDYIKAGRENAIDQRWMKELENASIRVRMSRLESLQLQMRQQVELLTAKRQMGASSLLGDIYKDSYYRNIFELQKGVGIGASFAKLNTQQIESLLTTPWAPDGSNFSQRIWGDRSKLIHELQTTLTQGLIRGDSSDLMISRLSERMGVSRTRAETLILTESAYFSGASRRASYVELNVEKYRNVATLDKRTSDICRTMDGSIFLVSEAKAGLNCAPFHARCRTVDIPYYEDNVKERAARGENGKTYDVPGDMNYEQWAKQHLLDDDIKPPRDQVVQPVEKVTQDEPPVLYKTFTTPDEIYDWDDAVAPDWEKALTKDERNAIVDYTGSDYQEINENLRNGYSEPIIDKKIEDISSGLQKFDLKEPVKVFRGLSHNIFKGFAAADLIGVKVTDPAFMSTSLLAKEAFSGKVQIELRLPPGTYGAPVISISSFPAEYEFLLDRAINYVIIDAIEDAGTLFLTVEVLPNGEGT